MIHIGLPDPDKAALIDEVIKAANIRKVFIISPERFWLDYQTDQAEVEQIKYKDAIRYVFFYRWLQEIDDDCLIVVNESLRTQNRYDLTYNCIRQYLNQTSHQLVFQKFPQIDTREDFMILFDFDTRSRWKRSKFDINLVLDHGQVQVNPMQIEFNPVEVPTTPATKQKYRRERKWRFETIGARDPHTIPRNLHLIGGKDKLAYIQKLDGDSGQMSLFGDKQERWYVARNQRLKHDRIMTYQNLDGVQPPITLVDWPHRFVDLTDFMAETGETVFDVLLVDLKVDHWYLQRYCEWRDRVYETYKLLQET